MKRIWLVVFLCLIIFVFTGCITIEQGGAYDDGSYESDGQSVENQEIVYCEDLGMSIEEFVEEFAAYMEEIKGGDGASQTVQLIPRISMDSFRYQAHPLHDGFLQYGTFCGQSGLLITTDKSGAMHEILCSSSISDDTDLDVYVSFQLATLLSLYGYEDGIAIYDELWEGEEDNVVVIHDGMLNTLTIMDAGDPYVQLLISLRQ